VLATASCATALAVISSTTALAQPVTNGLDDTADPAVIALVNADDQLVCTAALIAPHTALTAAHCVAGNPLTLRAFFGSSVLDGGTFIAVTNARAHPQFNPGSNDIAVVTLADAAPTEPLVLANPLDASLVGTSLRVVGFGLAGASIGGAGVKRMGTAKIAAVSAEDFTAVPNPSLSCLGDSGGPGLVAGDAIAGVVSRVDSLCDDHAVYTRADIAVDTLIAPYLAETAPGAAQEGEPCFYADHCADGLDCAGETERFCDSPAGCGCGTSDPSSLVIVVVGFAIGRRRRRQSSGRRRRRRRICDRPTSTPAIVR
jgi:MYXO-CTERM domain-containing protein